jgi:hypothetical protein
MLDQVAFSGGTIDMHKGSPMSFMPRAAVAALALLLCRPLYSCSIVVLGGYSPTVVRNLSGTVVGSGRFDLMGKNHDKERHAIAIGDAAISIKARTDTAFFKKGEVQYPPGVKPSKGNLKEWQCGAEVAAAKTGLEGNFAISTLQPGKYCLEITGPGPKDDSHVPMHESFLVDVVDAAPNGRLIADISPRWPDCSGGSSLTVKPLN